MKRWQAFLTAATVLPMLVLERIPGPMAWQVMCVAAALVVAAAMLLPMTRHGRVQAAAGVVAAVALAAVPRPPDALLALPAPLAALGIVQLILCIPARHGEAGPQSAGTRWMQALRFLPLGLLFTATAVSTVWSGAVPVRYGTSYEWHGPPGILVAGLCVALGVGTVALLIEQTRRLGRRLADAAGGSYRGGITDAEMREEGP